VKISRLLAGAMMVLVICVVSCVASGQEMAVPNASVSPSGRIPIPEPLLVTLQAVPGYGQAPLLVGFLIHAVDPSNGEIVSFSWNFGDGHFSTAQPTLAYNTYLNAGNYVASVTITTADGRSATGFTGVIVKPAAGATMQQRMQNQ